MSNPRITGESHKHKRTAREWEGDLHNSNRLNLIKEDSNIITDSNCKNDNHGGQASARTIAAKHPLKN
jgi:hypothetical protein